MHTYSQDQIAQAAGPLAVGAVAPWFTRHTVPIEPDEKGRVTVSRVISTGTLDCKEIVFSVDTDAKQDEPASSAFYVASVCRDGNQWKWASGGTGNATLGRAAMRASLGLVLAAGIAASCASLSGCSSIGAAAGAVAGISSGAVTSNPAVGVGVGIAVQAATDEAVNRVMKSLHGEQQAAIATTAGSLEIGETRAWRVEHMLPSKPVTATCACCANSTARSRPAASSHSQWWMATSPALTRTGSSHRLARTRAAGNGHRRNRLSSAGAACSSAVNALVPMPHQPQRIPALPPTIVRRAPSTFVT